MKFVTAIITAASLLAVASTANAATLTSGKKLEIDVDAKKIAEEGAEKLVVAFGGHRIAFDRRGPAFAECSCPAAGVCQHVLAASLFPAG